jgi:PAS domain S-box-containing protein
MHIVLIEDNEGLNKLICYKLRQEGYKATGYTMAAQIVEHYKEVKPDLLLIDYTLPDMNGKELVEVLKEMNYNVPFIIITGHSDIQLAISLMKMGAMDFIVKDDNFHDVLLAIVNKAIDQIKTKRRAEEARAQIVKNEALYRNTVDQIPDPIFYYHHDKVFFVNEAFRKKLKYSLNELNDYAFRKIVIDKYFRDAESEFNKPNGENTYPVFEIQLESKDGEALYFLVKTIKTRFRNTLAIMVVLSDITEKKAFEDRLMKSIIDTEEKERMRFARDLHDELGPILSGIKMYSGLLKQKHDYKADETLNKIIELVDSAVQTSRNLSSNVIPGVLIDFGLNKAVRNFLEQFSGENAPEFGFESNLESRFEQNTEISIYRIIKELVNNSLKHANASDIDIQIFETKGKKITLFYEDDGVGFDMEKVKAGEIEAGIGLRNIKNRLDMINADYTFETSPGEGFSFKATIRIG